MTESSVIRGTVDIGILHKADRLFRNDDRSVFIEILQNARRAGATKVDITLEEVSADTTYCVVTVEDNGSGIHDFQNLVTLGRSGWDEDTQELEDPAGMGFFSLCQSDVQVVSLGKSVMLCRDVFLGKTDAQVVDDTYIAGTRLRFTRESTRRVLHESVESVAEFCPLAVYLDGELAPQHDFLEGAIYRELIDGIEVGFATKFTHNFFRGYHDSNWNFYGAVIQESFPKITGVLEPNHRGPALALHARFNVFETSRVKLQLPDRRSVIESEFLTEFKRKATAAAYRCIQRRAEHGLSYKSWKEAHDLGIELPEAAFLLSTWSASGRDADVDPFFGERETKVLSDLNNVLLVGSDLPNEHTLQGTLHSGAKLNYLLYEANANYQGYSWYNRLPRLTDCDIFLDGLSYAECPKDMLLARPKTIEARITIKEDGHEDSTVCLPAVIHVDTDEELWGEPDFVAVQGSPWDKGEAGPFALSEFLVWATFMSSDNPDADSWQTQMDYHQELVDQAICDYFYGPRGTLLADLRQFLESKITHQANKLEVAEIRFSRPPQGAWQIELKRQDGTAV